jgi:hypothetical protein
MNQRSTTRDPCGAGWVTWPAYCAEVGIARREAFTIYALGLFSELLLEGQGRVTREGDNGRRVF